MQSWILALNVWVFVVVANRYAEKAKINNRPRNARTERKPTTRIDDRISFLLNVISSSTLCISWFAF
jgi:hypothetical protein